MALISTIYSIIFLPLIASLLCQILPKKNYSLILTIGCLVALLLAVAKIFPEIYVLQNISNDFELSPLSMALEFKLDVSSVTFLVSIILLNLIILFYYQPDIKYFLDSKNSKIFYSVYLLRVFAAIGIVTSNNLLNLFLFLEIYVCSFFAIFSIAKDEKIAKISFRYFSFNSAASLLILFSFLIIYLVFGSLNLDIIKQGLIDSTDSRFFIIVTFLLAVGFMIKFFPFWLYFENLKNSNLLANFFAIDSLFIKANLGIFFAIKFSYLFFASHLVSVFVIFVAAIMILYALFKIYRSKHLKLIAIYLCIVNFGLILICLAFNGHSSGQAAFFYWLNFNFVNLFIFMFATLLKRKFNTSSLQKILLIAPNGPLVMPLKFLVIFIAAFPFTFLFYGTWYLGLENLQFDQWMVNSLIIAVLNIMNFVLLLLAIKIANIIFFATNNSSQKDLIIERRKYWLYAISFWSMIIVIYGLVLCSDLLNKISLKFII